MREVNLAALASFLWLSAAAQGPSPTCTVRGVVLDVSSLQPIAGAEVWLSMIPVGPPGGPTNPPRTESRKGLSSRSGTFSFEGVPEGRFPIEARKEGYIPVRRVFEEAVWISVGSGEPEEVRLLLAPQPRLSGRIVEADSGNPVEGIQVQALLAFYQNGRRNLFPVLARAKSDSKGRFLFDSLLPAQYFLTVEPDAEVKEEIRFSATEEELGRVAAGHLRATWPDMRDLEVALPFVLDPGADLDVGDLRLQKGAGHRAVVRIHGQDCEAGWEAIARLTQSLGWLSSFRAMSGVPCDGEFLIRGLAPGTYVLETWLEHGNPEGRRFGHSTLTVVDRNVELDVSLGPGVRIAGKVVPPGQWTFTSALTISLLPMGGLRVSSEYSADLKTDGTFSFSNLEGIPHRLTLEGLGANSYIKSMEYNGTVLTDSVLPVSLSSPSSSLTLVLGDGPASVRGRVTDGDTPAREPYVVVVPWPARDPYLQAQQSRGDREGRFAFTGLAPGEYRIIAYREADGDKLEEPGILPMLLRKAKSLTLQERSIQSIDVEISRP